MTYLVDSNCFISAAQYIYPFDVAESFWKKISQEAQNHKFYSIDKVRDEIKVHHDDLYFWCNDNLPHDFFLSTETAEVYKKYGELAQWAQKKNIKQRGIDKFIDGTKADIYFVAFASLNPNEYIVVTEEVSAKDSQSDIKLPDACEAFGIKSIKFIQMFRELKIKF